MAPKKKMFLSIGQRGQSNTVVNVSTDSPQSATVKKREKREIIAKRFEPHTTRMAGERTIKVIAFSGKKEDFTDYWEDKFLARASRRGFQELLIRCKPE